MTSKMWRQGEEGARKASQPSVFGAGWIVMLFKDNENLRDGIVLQKR